MVWVAVLCTLGLAQDGSDIEKFRDETSLLQRVERLQDECRNLEGTLVETDEEQAALRRRIQARLTALYKFRALGYASTLFPVHEMSVSSQAGALMERVGSADHALVLRWREGLLRRRHLEGLLARRQMELDTLKGQLVSREGSAKRPGGDSADKAPDSSAELPTAQQRSDSKGAPLLKKIPHRKPIFSESAERFAALRGALPPPTVGEMVVTYGSKGEKRGEAFLHSDGVTFVAPQGQAVEAVFDGVVVFSDWLKEYGNVMIIDHGDHYHSLVAHAERLLKQVGDSVRRGEVVATVGSTGSSNTAQLYFEIRYHGKPVNPMEWLASGK